MMKKHGTLGYRIWLGVLLLLLLSGVLLLILGPKRTPDTLILPRHYTWGDKIHDPALSGRLF